MVNQAVGTLEHMLGGTSGLAFAAVPPPVGGTAPSTLGGELRGQRLRLIALYSLGIGLFGVAWCISYLLSAPLPTEMGWYRIGVTAPPAILGGAGWWALYRCRHGQLRRATYTNVAALILAATANLVFIRNAEGAAVVTYAVAVSLAALVIEGREWLCWGGIIAFSGLVGALLHSFPAFPQVVLSQALAAASLLCSSTLGFAVPMGLFWLFSRNLNASHEQAWRLAREAAAANRLATERALQLEQRSDQLQAKNAELSDLLYVVSHDLRAPLINLEGFSRALQEGVGALDGALDAAPRPARWAELKADIDESLDFIVRSAAKMDFLVQGLLELSRIDSRPERAQAVQLDGLVGDILDSLRYKISERGIAVRVDPLPVVVGDPLRISQVFGNLIDNAVKYMRPDGDAAIHVGCVRRDAFAHFFVRDTGIGIRPEDHAKIFRLFGRVGGHGVPGDGVGLTAVKKILEKHGGKIWVESALGQGSTFWFTLPGTGATEEQEEDRGAAAAGDQDSAG
jgi:signal transduction histidine kinase